jgi:nucleotide-binding universal stress UspA family protein
MPVERDGPVVVGVDGSASSMDAVDVAAEEATGRAVPLVIVHVTNDEPGERAAPPGVDVLEAAESRAYADHPSTSVRAELAVGEPADMLVARSVGAGACMLVVGHRRTDPREPSAGSVAQSVATSSTVPVLVHRALDTMAPTVDEPWPVVVCLAGRADDDQVIQFAFAEAAMRGAPLRAVHIWPGSGTRGATRNGFTAARDAADRMLVDSLTVWSEKFPDVAVHRVVRHGLDVPVGLTAASRSAQLIVVGSSRREGVHRSRVVESLVDRAACSVAVVPEVVPGLSESLGSGQRPPSELNADGRT